MAAMVRDNEFNTDPDKGSVFNLNWSHHVQHHIRSMSYSGAHRAYRIGASPMWLKSCEPEKSTSQGFRDIYCKPGAKEREDEQCSQHGDQDKATSISDHIWSHAVSIYSLCPGITLLLYSKKRSNYCLNLHTERLY